MHNMVWCLYSEKCPTSLEHQETFGSKQKIVQNISSLFDLFFGHVTSQFASFHKSEKE